MAQPFIQGEKIHLRGLTRDDLQGPYFGWLDDEEVTRYTESGRRPNNPEALEKYYEKMVSSPNDVMFAICENETGKHVGNAKLGPISWVHRYAEFGILIGDRDSWGRGYATEATRLTLDYAFRRLNLRKALLGVVADQVSAIRVYEKVGFKQHARIPDLLYIDGAFRDKIVMGISREDFYAARGSPS